MLSPADREDLHRSASTSARISWKAASSSSGGSPPFWLTYLIRKTSSGVTSASVRSVASWGRGPRSLRGALDPKEPHGLPLHRLLDVALPRRLADLEQKAHLEVRAPVGSEPLGVGVGRERLEERQHLGERPRPLLRKPEDLHAPRNGDRLDPRCAVLRQLHEDDLVPVPGLAERERDGRPGVADVLAPAHRLRQVEVPEGDVGHVVVEGVVRHRLEVPLLDLPLAQLAQLRPRRVEVPRQDDRLPVPLHSPRGGRRLRVDGRDARRLRVDTQRLPLVVSRSRETGEVRRPQVRHRRHPRPPHAVPVAQRDEEPVRVEAAVDAGQLPHDRHVERGQDLARRLEARRRVVVAGDGNDPEALPAPARRDEEPVPVALRRRGRVRGVEDVARDEERIDVALHDRVEEPREKGRVLLLAGRIVERVTEVPVGRVQEPHRVPFDATAATAGESTARGRTDGVRPGDPPGGDGLPTSPG